MTTGVESTTSDGGRCVRVQSSAWQKAIAAGTVGLLSAAVISAGSAFVEARDAAQQVKKIAPIVETNAEFRLRGDRVTPDDVQKAIKEISERYELSQNRLSELLSGFIESSNTTNRLLNDQTAVLSRVGAQVEAIQREAEIARQERNELRRSRE